MKTIETKYVGPGNVRGSRIIATDGDNRIVVPYDHGSRNPHADAALALACKLGWTGTLIEGHTKAGRVYVLATGDHFEIEAPK